MARAAAHDRTQRLCGLPCPLRVLSNGWLCSRLRALGGGHNVAQDDDQGRCDAPVLHHFTWQVERQVARAPLAGGALWPSWQAPQNLPSSISSWVKPRRALGKIDGWQTKHGYSSCCQWEKNPASDGSAAPCDLTMGTRTTTGMANPAADASTAAPATTSDHLPSIRLQCIPGGVSAQGLLAGPARGPRIPAARRLRSLGLFTAKRAAPRTTREAETIRRAIRRRRRNDPPRCGKPRPAAGPDRCRCGGRWRCSTPRVAAGACKNASIARRRTNPPPP